MRRVTVWDVVGGGFFGLMLPGAVLATWMIGTHTLFYPHGGGLSVMMLGLPLCAVVGLLGLWWLLHVRKGWAWHDLGFTKPRRSLWHLVWEVPAIMTAAAVIAALVGAAAGMASGRTEKATTGFGLAPVSMVLTVIVVTLLFPAIEEVIFRRLLYGWLQQLLPVVPAVLLAGVLFGACHVSPHIMLYVVPFGIGLTALRVRHGSLWASWIAHAVNNLTVSLVALTAA